MAKKKKVVSPKAKPSPQQTSSKPKKKINGAKKGKAFEREWANEIGHIFPEAKRHLEYQADEASHGVDLEGTDIFKFQLKNHQNYVSVGTIYEIKKLQNGEVPVLITKGNKLPTMAVLPATAFIHLLEVYYGLEPQKTTIPAAIENKKSAEKLRLILSETQEDAPASVASEAVVCRDYHNLPSLPDDGFSSARQIEVTISDLI